MNKKQSEEWNEIGEKYMYPLMMEVAKHCDKYGVDFSQGLGFVADYFREQSFSYKSVCYIPEGTKKVDYDS